MSLATHQNPVPRGLKEVPANESWAYQPKLELLAAHSGIDETLPYLPSNLDTVQWGQLPRKGDKPVLSVSSGSTVTIDTLSHEGMLPDQGSDPVMFFSEFGVAPDRVLPEAVDIVRNFSPAPSGLMGPHIVTGPIAVEGAMPGDVLMIEVLDLAPRVDYGIVSNRHQRGALPGEMPAAPGNVSVFCSADWTEQTGRLALSQERSIRFPLNPFLGIMGVATEPGARHSSVPPGRHGGNLDLRTLGVGSKLYLPVLVPGALAYVGDPHLAQGDGEVSLTAFEASLRATLRFTTIKASSASTAALNELAPIAESDSFWHPIGLHENLTEAMRDCVRKSLSLLQAEYDVDPVNGLAYLSAATDFSLAQVVDTVQGVYSKIRKSDFSDWS